MHRDNFTKEELFKALWFDINKVVYFDIETGNAVKRKGELDAWNKDARIALVQTRINGVTQLHDWNDETRDFIKKYIDEGYTFVGHNLSFELAWFYVHAKLTFRNVVDTMILSQVLNAGKTTPDEATIVTIKSEGFNQDHIGSYDLLFEEDEENAEESTKKAGRFLHNLAATAYRYAGRTKMKKDAATSDWLKRPLAPEQVEYARADVAHLERIVKNQLYFGYKYDMLETMERESRCVPAISAMQQAGVMISREEWEAAAEENQKKASELKEYLDKEYGLELGARETDLGEFVDFFGPIQKAFNVGSDTQLKNFHNIEKADESHLIQVQHPLIKSTLEFKQYKKLASTYGEGYTKHLKEDGRIHSALKQADTATGRLSSKDPNMQNIPGDILKSFVIAGEGRILMTADYSSVESRVLAYDSNDDVFIRAVNSTDVHWETAKLIWKLPDDAVVDADLRRSAKGVNFGIPYGISAPGLVNRGFAETIEQAQEIIDGWYSSYKGADRYLKKCIQEATVRGYTQDRTGRIRWYEIPDSTKVSEEDYKKAISRAARQGQNMKIQAISASITKQALIDCWYYLVDTGYGYMVLTVHDSIFFELNVENAHIAAPALQKIMQDAGPKIVPGIITPVDFDMGVVVKRTCKISGIKFKVYSHKYEDGVIVENDVELAPETIKCLKNLGVEINGDYMGMFVKAIERIPTKDEEWISNNKKWVNAMLETEKRAS